MANRPTGYGLTASLRRQRTLKYDYDDEQDALAWMTAVINEGAIFAGVQGMKATGIALKDGVYLCKLMTILFPGCIKKINEPVNAFKCMENICMFLTACRKYGVKSTDLFQTCDLYDETNINAVINTIHAVGRRAQNNEFDGPELGPREATPTPRYFENSHELNY